MAKATKVRLDNLLARRGLFASRTRAAASVLAGEVRLGAERRRADKPGQLVTEDVAVSLDEVPEFVSRGGRKLANALAATGIDPAGRQCLDAGASTGGFTDCLLQRGAAHVVALDVAYGELHWRLHFSFISGPKVLPAVLYGAAPRFDCLALVKPQFEAGREQVGRGGVVRDPAVRRAALVSVGEAAQRLGAEVLGFASSGLPGPKGNLETFAWLAEADREGGVADLEAAAREVEP